MNEQNEGMGGSYTLNPQTGERRLIERTTDEPTPAPEPEPEPEPGPLVTAYEPPAE